MSAPEFRPFSKISRIVSPVVITEKIDGTNGLVHVTDDGEVFAGSRSLWLDPTVKGGDNYGFGRWVTDNASALVAMLGPGWHYGEWFGQGIQRGYGLTEKRFYLFAVDRYRPALYPDITWSDDKAEVHRPIQMQGGSLGIVPVLRRSVEFNPGQDIAGVTAALLEHGSWIGTPYPRPEGFVVYFEHNRTPFKVVLDKHDERKPCPERDPNKPAKVKWTPEMIEAARKAAAERKALTA